MIMSKLQPAPPSAVIAPPISFPFLWRGSSGRVYLRFAAMDNNVHAKRGVDVRLIGTPNDRSADAGDLIATCIPDDKAWHDRLPTTEAVILSNA